MDPVAITIGISWMLGGLLCIGLSLPLIYGKVGPNAFYGARVPGAFASEEAWYAVNRFGGKWLTLWAIPMLVSGVIVCFLPLQAQPGLALAVGCIPLLFVLIPTAQTIIYAQQYKRGH